MTDTAKLLQECNSGTKMAVSSIDEVSDMVQDTNLKRLLENSKHFHEKIGNEIHQLLSQEEVEDKEPNPLAKGMSWMKTNMKMEMNRSDATAADLITDGCNMGVKSLHKYLNEYQTASPTAKDLCKRLADEEERLSISLRAFL